jgi:hypothetical protein
MGEPLPEFQRLQLAFATHIRDPEGGPLPTDVPPVRMAAYRELFFNNMEHFIASGFPVLKSLMGRDEWVALIRDFYARHRCATPLFIEIAEEFLVYIESERTQQAGDPPFILELAHYEWVELALAVAEAEPPELHADFEKDLLAAPIRLSPVAWPLAYRFQVHRIGPDYQPETPPETPSFLVVYRNRDDRVRFLEVNQVSYRLLECLDQMPGEPVRHYLLHLAEELQHPNPAQVLEFGAELVAQLHEKGVLGRMP